ncbi:hypothetical protein [Eisenbergiella sp.]
MDYFYSLTDSHGYVHSIDNCVITYYVHDVGIHAINRLIDDIHVIRDKHPELKYWEKLGINACRKYSFYQNAIHLDDGIYLLIGHYTDFDRDSKEAYIFPMMRLEINPNKHVQKPVFKDFMDLVNKVCYDGVLNRYDYAVDILAPLNDVQVFGSNKEKGLYKGTRYFGQRNRNGFCRIYDKSAEQGMEEKLTRVEHVISLTKSTKNISFEKVYIKSDKEELEDISKTDEVIVKLCVLCEANGLEYGEILNGLDRRKKKTIISHISGCGYQKLEYDKEIHDKLLDFYRNYFGIKVNKNDGLETDNDGFFKLEEYDPELPFD